MDKMADTLGRAGAWAGQNRYLSAIKNAFQSFMPLTIAGAIGVLWSNVLVNEATGLGQFFAPIMALEFLNPAFNAIVSATIGCITLGVTFGIATEIGNSRGEKGYFTGLLGVAGFVTVTQLAHVVAIEGSKVEGSFSGISMGALGATGLFTGMIVGILSVEVFCALKKVDALKIKMPETVPPGVARAFEDLIPAFIVLVFISCLGLACVEFTGKYLNDVIASVIQEPLMGVGSSLPGLVIINILIMLFWLVGIHGNNMLAAVKESILTPLMLQNTKAFDDGLRGDEIPNVVNMGMQQMFAEFGGSGVTIGLVIAIFIFSRREDNRAVATLSVAPGIFNINETVTFGIPMVLNPILGIPFILAPVACIITGYFLTVIGFCPKVVLPSVWTCPPIIFGFVFTGGNIMGAVSQIIVLVLSTVIYTPFLIAYEKQQNKEAAVIAD